MLGITELKGHICVHVCTRACVCLSVCVHMHRWGLVAEYFLGTCQTLGSTPAPQRQQGDNKCAFHMLVFFGGGGLVGSF